MSYKSILVHASQGAAGSSGYRLAAAIALAEGARLAAVATSGVTEFLYRYAAATALAPLAPEDLGFLTAAALADLAAFTDAVRGLGLADTPTRINDGVAATALPLEARFCDLLVIGQNHAADTLLADQHAVARTLVAHVPCPVLVVPSAPSGTPAHGAAPAPPVAAPARVLLAWDGSMEASRAVRAALPLLRRAGNVAAVTFNPSHQALEAGAPGAALADYLAHHGIALELLTPSDSGNTGRALLALAAARSTDLIVMGCYSHSRLHEIVLGGVTNTVLAETRVPVLMAH